MHAHSHSRRRQKKITFAKFAIEDFDDLIVPGTVSPSTLIMSDEAAFSRAELLGLFLRVAALSAISYFTVRWMVDAVDPTKKQKIKARERAKQIM